MSLSLDLDPNHATKTPRALKAERTTHRVTFNPSKASPGETLYITIPRLDNNVVIVPGSLALRFNLILSGHTNNFVVDNVTRALVNRLTIKIGGELLQDTNRMDLFQLYSDLFLSKHERKNRIDQGIQSANLNKLRSKTEDASSSNATENAVNSVYGSNYRLPLGEHSILRDRGALYPSAMNESIVFQIVLAPADQIVRVSDPTKLGYSLDNIQLEYEAIRSESLAQSTVAVYRTGKMFLFDHVSLFKQFSIARNTDSVFNQTINAPRRSMKGILLLFVEPYTAVIYLSQKFFNPDITSMKVSIDGTNKVFSQGIIPSDMWN